MDRKSAAFAIPALLGLSLSAAAQPLVAKAEIETEKDYLDEVPIVLSVSRLPQRLDETPGAVTIIDRQMIRMSGARDVADLLRLVPGFRVTNSFESNTPQASYHTASSDYSNHLQVMVDGRSVYSTYLQGSTGPGLQTMALDDIERIEVYRGSNSAAYGARAFLGSINIVTRDPAETHGTYAHLAGGDRGIQDGMVRLGWGGGPTHFRLSADGRGDSNLQGTSGPVRVQRVNLRGDMRLGRDDVVEMRVGQSVVDAGVGFSDQDGNNVRTRQIDTSYLQFDWRRSLNLDSDLALQVSRTVEAIKDNFVYAPAPSLLIDFGGRATNDNLLLQHTWRAASSLRLVWGGELRRESVESRPLFNTSAAFVNDFARAFTNAEWRMHPDWLLNAGALYERSTIAGEQVAPRLMLNWRAAPGHTLRYGLSQAFRPPSTFEKYADVRYYINGSLADSTYVARGNVSSEKVQTRELGYLAELPQYRLSLDLRIFEEKVRNYIKEREYSLPGSGNGDMAKDYLNDEEFNIHGWEVQLKLRPWRDGQLVYSQSQLYSTQWYSSDQQVKNYGMQSVMLMQQFPQGFNASLLYFQADASAFVLSTGAAPAYSRTDVRVARSFRLAGKPAEISLVAQNLGTRYQDFGSSLYVRQQTYLMLRVEN